MGTKMSKKKTIPDSAVIDKILTKYSKLLRSIKHKHAYPKGGIIVEVINMKPSYMEFIYSLNKQLFRIYIINNNIIMTHHPHELIFNTDHEVVGKINYTPSSHEIIWI
jgi:hypothetical protein